MSRSADRQQGNRPAANGVGTASVVVRSEAPMRISPFKLISGLVAAAALLLSFGTSAVLAKEGVSVNLLAPLPAAAAPATVAPAAFAIGAISTDALSPLHHAPVSTRLQ